MSDKLTLELDEAQAHVLAAALSVLPIFVNGRTIEGILDALDEDERMLLCLVNAALAGAKDVRKVGTEMSEKTLKANMMRARDLLVELKNKLEKKELKDA
ncbi:MAG: hypothetical protein L0Z53_06700 [Acidobacteriales bacterium]|nr:hypothetical protein [Terriglobales bacterium]